MSAGPTLDLDLYGKHALADPLPVYAAIRDAGPAVWLPRHRMWAIGRHRDVRTALEDAETFASGAGIAANPLANALADHTVLASDGEVHARRRRVMLGHLAPRRLDEVAASITARAEQVIPRLTHGRWFDAVPEFSSALPVEVAADLVGVRVEADRMLRWGRSTFDLLGPVNRRSAGAALTGLRLHRWTRRLDADRVRAGGWAAGVFAAAERGEISMTEARTMIIDFVVPSLDTTVLASTELLYRLGSTPGLWDLVRADPTVVPGVVAEAVRLAAPVRGFTRRTTREVDVDGVRIPAGARVAVLFASANHDERAFPDPEVFDHTRRADEHVGWGHGPHACVGMHLSKLEMQALLLAMRPRVAAVHVSAPLRLHNNTLGGWRSLPARFDADGDQAAAPVTSGGTA